MTHWGLFWVFFCDEVVCASFSRGSFPFSFSFAGVSFAASLTTTFDFLCNSEGLVVDSVFFNLGDFDLDFRFFTSSGSGIVTISGI